MDWAEQKYDTLYRQLDFERKGLFQFLYKTLGNQKVLYPGCSFHITPSFYFSKVTYTDKSDEVARFFNQKESVLRLIDGEKSYKEQCNLEFIHATFGKDEIKLNKEYGLLLSIFAGDITRYFLPYVKSAGYILTSNHFSDLKYIQSRNFQLIGTIKADRKSVYRFVASDSGSASKNSSVKNNGKYIFRDNLTYFLYQTPD
ncbi:MAG TPA: hypothetical protein VIK89_10550 [Cytophagaceae bacterium]